MNMKSYALISLVMLCFLGKSYPSENRISPPTNETRYRRSDSTLLVSNLKGSDKAKFFYVDDLGNAMPPFEVAMNSAKKISINKPILLISSPYNVPYLIYPNETILVSKNDKGSITLTVKNNAFRTKELLFFSNLIKEQRYLFGTAQLASKEFSISRVLVTTKPDVVKLESEALNHYKLRLAYLESNRKLLSVTSYNYIKTLFKYLYLGDCLYVTNIETIKLAQLPQSYLEEMRALDKEFKCDECLDNLGYQIAANQYFFFLSRLKQTGPNIADKYELISKSFDGNTKRFLLFSLLRNPVLKGNVDYQPYLNTFLAQEADSYSDYLKQDHEEKIDKKYELMDPNGKLISWQQLLKNHRGSTIYVDFWASWCIPCRKMMPFSHELQNKLADAKVSFLYISCDKSVSDWKNAIKQENLDKAENYIVTDQKANLLTLFKIPRIPRYMIVDKDGNIIDQDAVHPDHKELMQKLTTLQQSEKTN